MTAAADPTTTLVRTAHKYLEPVHTSVYFVPEARDRYAAAGVKGSMRGYFASRSAPLGPAPLEVVVATFYNFAPSIVAQAIPSVWETSSPAAMIEARLDVVDASLRRMLDVADPGVAEASELAREASTACTVQGRPLYAAHAALPWPDQPHLVLWHAATLLREHRGDGHIAALLLAGLSGLEAAVSYVATGRSMDEELMRTSRGYSEEEWAGGKESLRERGLLAADGSLTEAGSTIRQQLEDSTDRAAAAPYRHLGEEKTTRLIELAKPLARSLTKQIFG
jgi:hypothetical protein